MTSLVCLTVHPLYGTDMIITTHTRDTEVDMFMAATDALLQYRTVLYSRDCLLYRNRLMCTRDSPLLLILSNHYYGKSFYMLPNQTLPYRLLYQIPRQPLCCFATLSQRHFLGSKYFKILHEKLPRYRRCWTKFWKAGFHTMQDWWLSG